MSLGGGSAYSVVEFVNEDRTWAEALKLDYPSAVEPSAMAAFADFLATTGPTIIRGFEDLRPLRHFKGLPEPTYYHLEGKDGPEAYTLTNTVVWHNHLAASLRRGPGIIPPDA